MQEFDFEQIKEVLKLIFYMPELQGKVFLSGGAIPYVLMDANSPRKHEDIDIICRQSDMALIRELLKLNGLYHPDLDSLTYPQNAEHVDYGASTLIHDVPVGFYPYVIENGNIIQRSFTPMMIGTERDFKVKIIPELAEEDYITTSTLADGTVFGHTTLEVLIYTKMAVGREKDLIDIKAIEKLGINQERLARVEATSKNMYDTLEERRRGAGSRSLHNLDSKPYKQSAPNQHVQRPYYNKPRHDDFDER